MEVVKIECPGCGADLEGGKKTMYCRFCGAKLMLNDNAQNINYTYKKIDVAKIREKDLSARLYMKAMENQEKEMERKRRVNKRFLIVLAVVLAVCLLVCGLVYALTRPGDPKADEVQMISSAEAYKGAYYEQVKIELENAGFTNIELVVQEDLITGWITKDGSVERVSINGEDDFHKGDIFPKDASVLITYHSFKPVETIILQ
ncbi:MAG: hypothetical protein IJ512_06445 [Ruminococcus sp.]|nr:hypothetical protein [Ruminococcus sp.]